MSQHPSPRELRSTVTAIDRLSQGVFGSISSAVWDTLDWLDRMPGTYFPHRLAESLRAAGGLADEALNDINCLAESVGCQYRGACS